MPGKQSLLFGKGAYSFADGARLTGASARDLRRWVPGEKKGDATKDSALWTSQLAGTDVDGIGFKDLIELRFVRMFRSEGVSLQVIRRTLEVAREQFSVIYPFTCQRFRTDGRQIFLEVVEASGDASLVDLSRRQNVIQKVMGPSLRAGVELDLCGEAARWFPMKQSRAVVLDPSRSFGMPVLAESGIPTAAISEALIAEGNDERRVARCYEIPVGAVRRAAEFESQMRAA
jgi:DNA-binding transcriptional MerR regulator/uncharacterized protein (DUF433 family)